MNITEQYLKLPTQGFGLNDFFDINITQTEISCFAWYTDELFNKYKNFGFVFIFNNEGNYLQSEKDGIKILLSLKNQK